MDTDLSKYTKGNYSVGKNKIVQLLWYMVNHTVFMSAFFVSKGLKRFLLRLFGAKVGKCVVIKPCVNIKFPWRLSVGENSWIGEGVWIDNHDNIIIGKNCCISQGVLLETGSHNYKSLDFKLITAPITIHDGAWICAKSVVLPKTEIGKNVVLSASSVIQGNTEEGFIYRGNPAIAIKKREQ